MPVLLRVMLARLARMMRGVVLVPMRHMRMMSRRLMIAALMLLRGGAMVLGRVLMVFRRFAMMLGCFFRHGISPFG